MNISFLGIYLLFTVSELNQWEAYKVRFWAFTSFTSDGKLMLYINLRCPSFLLVAFLPW